MRALIFAGVLALGAGVVGCAARADRSPEAPTVATGEAPLRPDQIEAILRASPRTYRVRATSPVAASMLTEVVPDGVLDKSRRLDPFLEVTQIEGRPRLRSALPDEVLEPLFSRASDAFHARDYDAASRLYGEAVKARPRYFKSYTYLGNALYFLGHYVEAERAFDQALVLNPFDYQAHLFLGDTLHQLGQYREAKDRLTYAFMLNRENDVVRERLDSSLAKVGLAVRKRRLTPRIRVEPDRSGGVIIRLDRNRGGPWYPLAACLACWSYEDACRGRSNPPEDPLHLSMYRECLLNQAAASAARQSAGKELAADELALLSAVEDGYLEAVVFWEVVAPGAPAVMLLVPETLRDDVLEYIERYVFVSTRMVEGRSGSGRRFAP